MTTHSTTSPEGNPMKITEENEEWRSIYGYEGRYEISNQGRVRRVPGSVTRRDGVVMPVKGRVLTPVYMPSGHIQVGLTDAEQKQRTFQVHRLVLETFVGPCPKGMECCHADDDPTNNRLTNLRWDTHLENMRDCVRRGRHNESRKTHCAQGHEYTPENTGVSRPEGRFGDRRNCRTCIRNRSRERRLRIKNGKATS